LRRLGYRFNGVPLFNSLFWGESLNYGVRNLVYENWKHHCRVVQDVFGYIEPVGVDYQRDRRTYRQADRITTSTARAKILSPSSSHHEFTRVIILLALLLAINPFNTFTHCVKDIRLFCCV